MFGLITRRQHERELASLNAELKRVTADRNRLSNGRSVQDVLEEHDVHRKALADALGDQKRHLNWDQLITEVGGWIKAAHAWMADYEAEKKRADLLEKGGEVERLQRRIAQLERQLDDALGMSKAVANPWGLK